jgi:tRNA threonylcarbamoyl adenosine modification protein (Sua5/YciO/YrdC/YwlC family)
VAEVYRDIGDEALSAAVGALGRGGLVVFPTETVFGVAARPDVADATARLFEAKRRPRGLTLPVLAPDAVSAWSVGVASRVARRLGARYWPGALTLVLPRTDRSVPWDLGEDEETVGVRVPDHPTAGELLARAGPLAGTSANLSGEPTPDDCDGVHRSLGDAVDVYLCGGPSPVGTVSTVVAVRDEEWSVLRPGAISEDEISEVLR